MDRGVVGTMSVLVRVVCAMLTLRVVESAFLRATQRDMTARQIPGVYRHVPISPETGFCAPQLRIAQVEPVQTANGVLFVIPHIFISLPLDAGTSEKCVGTPVDSDITNVSSTVLRMSSQVRLDESVDLIAKFKQAGEQFFLGFEIGPRVCGRLTLPAGSISMWVAPDRVIRGTAGPYALTFEPGSKYIYYFSESQPCFYRGNANEMGVVATVPSPSPSPSVSASPSASASPSPLDIIDDSTSDDEIIGPVIIDPVDNDDGFVDAPVIGQQQQEGPACFPADATVVSERRGRIRMDEVRVGEAVQVDVWGGYSRVILFTHAAARARAQFVELSLERNRTLRVSAGHIVYGNGETKLARDVRVGDWMMASGGERTHVVAVRRVLAMGVYNAQTMDGNLMVDDLLVTTYTETFWNWATAHALLVPIRMSGALVDALRCV